MDIKKVWKEARSWLLAIGFILFLRGFIVQTFHVPSGSMKDTILIGDCIIVNRLKYGIKLPFTDRYLLRTQKPKREDIIVFRYPMLERTLFKNTNFVKRCVAVPGDTVYIEHKQLYVNGKPKAVSYIFHRDLREYPPLNLDNEVFQRMWQNRRLSIYPYVRDNFGPVVIPEGYVFAMGDNRDNSDDSRFWGPVPINNISGTPIFVYWSWNSHATFFNFFQKVRWGRIGKVFSTSS